MPIGFDFLKYYTTAWTASDIQGGAGSQGGGGYTKSLFSLPLLLSSLSIGLNIFQTNPLTRKILLSMYVSIQN